ncbi:MAG: MgtC/SapB family protein [Hydrogenophaga sp.]|nr:MgtC/SapB family protein [Hydrogenophaga sp.]MDO9438112.1 MgtC/SapB family protein [Hydrogenophaga sp.]
MSVLQTIWLTVQAEFGDFAEVERITRATWRMGEALVLGAAIGWDRERRDAEAGLRTHMLVALGAAMFVLIPMEAGMDKDQLSRVVQGLVSGIGFLGAGAVLKDQEEGRIHGLTTAASLWATAAIGLAAGMGLTGTALLATVFILVVLVWLRRLGRAAHKRGDADPSEHRDR